MSAVALCTVRVLTRRPGWPTYSNLFRSWWQHTLTWWVPTIKACTGISFKLLTGNAQVPGVHKRNRLEVGEEISTTPDASQGSRISIRLRSCWNFPRGRWMWMSTVCSRIDLAPLPLLECVIYSWKRDSVVYWYSIQ